MAEVYYLVSVSDAAGYFWCHLKFFKTYDDAKDYIQGSPEPGKNHRIKDFTRQQAKEADLEEKWLECDKVGKVDQSIKEKSRHFLIEAWVKEIGQDFDSPYLSDPRWDDIRKILQAIDKMEVS